MKKNPVEKYIEMVEGGGDFGYDNPWLDHDLDHDDDDDDEQEANSTQPFHPNQASTPYHGGERVEIQTVQHEKSGLPCYEETSFGGEKTPLVSHTDDELSRRLSALRENAITGILDVSKIPNARENPLSQENQNKQIERAKRYIKLRFPSVDFNKLGPIRYSSKNPLQLVVIGPGGGETPIFLKDGSDFQQQLLNKTFVKNAFGPSGKDVLNNTYEKIRKTQKILKQRRQDQARFFEQKEDKEKEELDLKRRIELEQEKKAPLEDNPAANKAEIKRREQLIKNLNKDFKTIQKEKEQLQKNYESSQKQNEKISRLEASISQEIQKRNYLERRLNSTRSFDFLKEKEGRLIRLNKEDQEIINDENAPDIEKETAVERLEARNEELSRLQTQIGGREDTMPLRERIKEIFKKHSVTLTAVILAASVTIGSVVSAVTKALKASGQAMSAGLKQIGAKLGSLLPGLIGQIAHFLFNTAAKAVGFLAEHTWLLILAAVAFVAEKYLKKRK